MTCKRHPSWKLRFVQGFYANKPRRKMRDHFTFCLIEEVLELREKLEKANESYTTIS